VRNPLPVLAVCATLYSFSAGFALEPDAHTLFLCHYDTNGDADFSVGCPYAAGVVALTRGKSGKALLAPLSVVPFSESVAPIFTGVQYASDQNLCLGQGTIELWVQVLKDTGSTDESSPKLRYLVNSGRHTGENHGFALLLTCPDAKPGARHRLVWKRSNGNAKGRSWGTGVPVEWAAGEWHHVAATYSASEDALFVDGRRVAAVKTGEGMDLIGYNFSVGASIYRGRVADCVIDELRISDSVRYTGDFTP